MKVMNVIQNLKTLKSFTVILYAHNIVNFLNYISDSLFRLRYSKKSEKSFINHIFMEINIKLT